VNAYEGKTQARRKVMTAYRGMTYSHLRADYLYTGISSGPNARERVCENFTFLLFRRQFKVLTYSFPSIGRRVIRYYAGNSKGFPLILLIRKETVLDTSINFKSMYRFETSSDKK